MFKWKDPEQETIKEINLMNANYEFNCIHCKWFKGSICKAFPGGIPIPIKSGQKVHNKPLYSQGNNITFVSR